MEGSESEAMRYGLELIVSGVLSIDQSGFIWRHKIKCSKSGRWRNLPQRRRAESDSGKGYLRITLGIQGKTWSVQAHRLIWAHANGAIPDQIQINHKDLNKRNNRIDNLELVTQAENIRHSYANGRPRPWYQATIWRGKPRITEEQKAAMRRRKSEGVGLRRISKEFGVSLTHTQRIISCEA
jgi:hypothetical protein